MIVMMYWIILPKIVLSRYRLKLMSVIKRGDRWWVDIAHNRSRIRRSCPANTKAAALEYESLIRQRIARGEPIDGVKEKTYPVFSEFADKWLETYVRNNNKPSEVKNKKNYLRSVLVPFFGKLRLNEINTLHIEQFKIQQQDKGLNPKTINLQVGTLAKCLRTAVDWEILDKTPIFKNMKTSPSQFDFLTEEEAERLLKHSTDSVHTAILIALNAGLRLGELLALTWECIDFRNKSIIVKQSISAGILGSTKSNRIRYIPMTSQLYDHLVAMYPKDGYVLKRPDGTCTKAEWSRLALREACIRASLRFIGWHKLRHTFCTRLAEKGVQPFLIKDLMGHSDIKTTMRYTHPSQSHLREAIKALDTNFSFKLRHNHGTIDVFSQNKNDQNCVVTD